MHPSNSTGGLKNCSLRCRISGCNSHWRTALDTYLKARNFDAISGICANSRVAHSSSTFPYRLIAPATLVAELVAASTFKKNALVRRAITSSSVRAISFRTAYTAWESRYGRSSFQGAVNSGIRASSSSMPASSDPYSESGSTIDVAVVTLSIAQFKTF